MAWRSRFPNGFEGLRKKIVDKFVVGDHAKPYLLNVLEARFPAPGSTGTPNIPDYSETDLKYKTKFYNRKQLSDGTNPMGLPVDVTELGRDVAIHMPMPEWMRSQSDVDTLNAYREETGICLPGLPSTCQGTVISDLYETDSYRLESNRSGK